MYTLQRSVLLLDYFKVRYLGTLYLTFLVTDILPSKYNAIAQIADDIAFYIHN